MNRKIWVIFNDGLGFIGLSFEEDVRYDRYHDPYFPNYIPPDQYESLIRFSEDELEDLSMRSSNDEIYQKILDRNPDRSLEIHIIV